MPKPKTPVQRKMWQKRSMFFMVVNQIALEGRFVLRPDTETSVCGVWLMIRVSNGCLCIATQMYSMSFFTLQNLNLQSFCAFTILVWQVAEGPGELPTPHSQVTSHVRQLFGQGNDLGAWGTTPALPHSDFVGRTHVALWVGPWVPHWWQLVLWNRVEEM